MQEEPVPCFVTLRGQDLLLVNEVHMAPWQCAECGVVLSLYGGEAATPQETGLIEVWCLTSAHKVEAILLLFLLDIYP